MLFHFTTEHFLSSQIIISVKFQCLWHPVAIYASLPFPSLLH